MHVQVQISSNLIPSSLYFRIKGLRLLVCSLSRIVILPSSWVCQCRYHQRVDQVLGVNYFAFGVKYNVLGVCCINLLLRYQYYSLIVLNKAKLSAKICKNMTLTMTIAKTATC